MKLVRTPLAAVGDWKTRFVPPGSMLNAQSPHSMSRHHALGLSVALPPYQLGTYVKRRAPFQNVKFVNPVPTPLVHAHG